VIIIASEKKTKIVTIRLDDKLYRNIELQANTEHREISEFIRHTVQVYLEKIEEVRKITL